VKVYPAIDLKDGRAVRLLQGKMDAATVYAENPAEVAKDFLAQGTKYLHVVDLNGAFEGKPVNDRAIKQIIEKVSLKIQVGGGIRTLERISELLNLGVSRVILGTAAVKNPKLVEEAVKLYGDQIVVGVDARDGMAAVQGWAEGTNIKAEDLGLAMKKAGVNIIVYTDISRDGMLAGPNVASTVRMAENTGLKVIASGGISALEDLRMLKAEAERGINIEGVIIGKALYSGAFTLREALDVVGEERE